MLLLLFFCGQRQKKLTLNCLVLYNFTIAWKFGREYNICNELTINLQKTKTKKITKEKFSQILFLNKEIAQQYSVFDGNFQLTMKLFNKKKYSKINETFNKLHWIENSCVMCRKENRSDIFNDCFRYFAKALLRILKRINICLCHNPKSLLNINSTQISCYERCGNRFCTPSNWQQTT